MTSSKTTEIGMQQDLNWFSFMIIDIFHQSLLFPIRILMIYRYSLIHSLTHSFVHLLNLFCLPTAVKSPRDTKINSCLLSRCSQTFEQHFTSYKILLTKMIQASLHPLQCITITFILHIEEFNNSLKIIKIVGAQDDSVTI